MRATAVALTVLCVLALMAVSFAAGLVAGKPELTTSAPPTASPRPTPTVTPTPTPVPPTPAATPTPEPGIAAQAVVVPLRHLELVAPYTAVVEAVFVSEGSEVREGQVLLRLDTTTRSAAVELAETDLDRARAAADRARLIVEQLPEDASDAQREAAEADLRLAEAEVEVAQAALDAARASLRQAEVLAPFDGTVAALEIGIGGQAIAGRPLATVADMSGWLFETTDVSELEVVRIAVGDSARISVTALPELSIEGAVEQIRVRGGATNAGVRFDVIIRPLEHHPELRWNMTAVVRILPAN